MNYTKQAKNLKNMGISVVPLRTDSKLPKMKWKPYITRIMSDKEIDEHFKDCGGIAAVTGEVSNLYLLDFDLKYQTKNQDFWKDFMAEVPDTIKKKMLINKTKNNGFHIWMRTDFEAKSTHLTRRASTIPELMIKHSELVELGRTSEQASELILRKPFEVIIETRSRGSYGVITHKDYKRFYGKKIHKLTVKEIESLNEIARSLDYSFIKKEIFSGSTKDFSTLKKYNENSTGDSVLDVLVRSGMFSFVETERSGNMTILRIGSNSIHSGRIYRDTGVVHLFTTNSIFDISSKSSFSPFETYCIINNLTKEQAIIRLSKS